MDALRTNLRGSRVRFLQSGLSRSQVLRVSQVIGVSLKPF
jgi:hypothetical protein